MTSCEFDRFFKIFPLPRHKSSQNVLPPPPHIHPPEDNTTASITTAHVTKIKCIGFWCSNIQAVNACVISSIIQYSDKNQCMQPFIDFPIHQTKPTICQHFNMAQLVIQALTLSLPLSFILLTLKLTLQTAMGVVHK